MKLLIVTQRIDRDDANLGFFIRWVEAFAEQCAEVVVIANEVKGVTWSHLNISLRSLGKEKGASRFRRLLQYRRILKEELPLSDGVFFHMCPEYAIAAGRLPHKFRKKSILWYVHKEVSTRLRAATFLVSAIFTASRESCRLNSHKIHIVGHGIDTTLPFSVRGAGESKHFVTVGRISPVKDLFTILRGFERIQTALPDSDLSVIGEPITSVDCAYRAEMLKQVTSPRIHWKSLPFGEAYNQSGYTAFVHASRTGSMDKAVLEALAAGLPVFTSSEAFSNEIPGVTKFAEGNPADLAEKIAKAFEKGEIGYNEAGREWVKKYHNLDALVKKIVDFYRT